MEATSIDGAGVFGIYRYVIFAVTLSKPASQPITVALAQLAALPTLLVYILFGRYFIRGLLCD